MAKCRPCTTGEPPYRAVDEIAHYHQRHTSDKITRFRDRNMGVDVYVVSDPEWIKKLDVFTSEEFPDVPRAETPVQRKTE